jgi:hypothetical protein
MEVQLVQMMEQAAQMKHQLEAMKAEEKQRREEAEEKSKEDEAKEKCRIEETCTTEGEEQLEMRKPPKHRKK